MIVAGAQKGVGSSRETAAQCEVFSGSRLAIASSFAPIHARNNINIGQLMGDHAMLRRLEAGESIALSEFTRGPRRDHRADHRERRPACRSARGSSKGEITRAGDRAPASGR